MTTSSVAALPFFELGHITIPGIGIDIQYFGILVATGVLIGASLLRRYAERFDIDDEDIRGMTAWVVVSGFLGAHIFDVLAYQQDELSKDPLILLWLWKGISSYGGFIGGSIGWFIYQWWKRMQTGLWADVTVVGLLPAFTIGRIGCTVVSDHVGSPTGSFLGMDYPWHEVKGRLCPQAGDVCPDWLMAAPHDHVIRCWNLGLAEFLYLLPVNAIVLWLAFKKPGEKRLNAGFLAVISGALYAPVRFILEFARPDQTDPRYLGFTFAQWASVTFFLVAAASAFFVWTRGKPALLAADVDKKYLAGRKVNVMRPGAAEIEERERKANKRKKKA